MILYQQTLACLERVCSEMDVLLQHSDSCKNESNSMQFGKGNEISESVWCVASKSFSSAEHTATQVG